VRRNSPVNRARLPQVPDLASSVGGRGEERRVRGLDGQHLAVVAIDDVRAYQGRADFHLCEQRERESARMTRDSRRRWHKLLTRPL
jgi:hypothetical protein